MSEEKNSTKRHHLTREDEADKSLNHTEYSAGSAWLTVLVFLGVVLGVLGVEHVTDIQANQKKRAEWEVSKVGPEPGITPRIYGVFALLPKVEQIQKAKGFWGYWDLLPSTDSINAFEDDLKKNSLLTTSFLSPTQTLLTGTLGVGNERAFCGKPGWLFYRDDVEYLTSDGFLTPKRLSERQHGAKEIQPDPVKAIVDFKQQLSARNIQLILMPMPTKPMIESDMLVGTYDPSLQNPSYQDFLAAMSANKVQVFEPERILRDRKVHEDAHQYLETDTHWTPDAMEAVSSSLGEFIKAQVPLPPVKDFSPKIIEKPVSNLGDIAEMLKLPKGQTIYKPQTVDVHTVIGSDGQPLVSTRDGDVLLLGDSFCNIFSLGTMNWGEGAGFPEHLSYQLKRPIDKIVINAGGADKTRLALSKDMRGSDRLAGKRVVIWEFSMRDLSEGDWKLIRLPNPPKEPSGGGPIVVPPKTNKVTPTAFTLVSISHDKIDPAKSESTVIKFRIPAGQWSATVLDANGKPIRELANGIAKKDNEEISVEWDGLDAKKAAVPAGAFTVKIEDVVVGPTGTAKLGMSLKIIVVGPPTGKLEALGCSPDHIDPEKKESTTATFEIPADGDYQVDVLRGAGRSIKRLVKKKITSGSFDAIWNGADSSGKAVQDGTYQIRIKATEANTKVQAVASKVVVLRAKVNVPTVVKPGKNGGGNQGGGPKNGKDPAKAASSELIVEATISDRSVPPAAGSVPYKEALIMLELTNIHVKSGTMKSSDVLVYVWGMRDGKNIDGPYTKGGQITMKLVPWRSVESKYGSYNRVDLDKDLPDLYWGELK